MSSTNSLRRPARPDAVAAQAATAETIAAAEAEAAAIVATARERAEAEGRAAAEKAVELVARAEAEAVDLLSGAQDEATAGARKAMELITRAEAEAAELVAEARAEADAVRAENQGWVEKHQRQQLAAEKDALEKTRERLDRQQAQIDAETAKIARKTEILAEAQEAFIEERTLLQRRWAETERQGVVALERAHEEADRILRAARAHATELAAASDDERVADDTNQVTAEKALARLEEVLFETRADAESRAARVEAEHGQDNATESWGAWEGADGDSHAQATDAEVVFDGGWAVEPAPPDTFDMQAGRSDGP